MKKIAVIFILLLTCLVFFVSCGEGNAKDSGLGLTGSWYDTTNIEDSPLILAEDGTCANGDAAGHYAVEGNVLILEVTTAGYESTTVEIGECEGQTCLIEDDGTIWLKGYDEAKAYRDKIAAEEIEQMKSEYCGRYEYTENNYIVLNEDGTYEYGKTYLTSSYYSGWQNAGQTGTWETYDSNGELYLKLYPENSWQEEENNTQNPWVKSNEPVFSKDPLFGYDDDDGRMYLYYSPNDAGSFYYKVD